MMAVTAQHCHVYTYRILRDDAFVDLVEFFCVCQVHVKLYIYKNEEVKKNRVKKKQNNNNNKKTGEVSTRL